MEDHHDPGMRFDYDRETPQRCAATYCSCRYYNFLVYLARQVGSAGLYTTVVVVLLKNSSYKFTVATISTAVATVDHVSRDLYFRATGTTAVPVVGSTAKFSRIL